MIDRDLDITRPAVKITKQSVIDFIIAECAEVGTTVESEEALAEFLIPNFTWRKYELCDRAKRCSTRSDEVAAERQASKWASRVFDDVRALQETSAR